MPAEGRVLSKVPFCTMARYFFECFGNQNANAIAHRFLPKSFGLLMASPSPMLCRSVRRRRPTGTTW